MKEYFLAKEICSAFEIPSRTFQYWLDQGLIVADIRDRQPREYSPREAIIAGLIDYLIKKGGYTVARSARIARLAVSSALLIYDNMEEEIKNSDGLRIKMEICNGVIGWVYHVTEDMHVHFLAAIDISDDDEAKTMQDIKQHDVMHTYKLSHILDALIVKLGYAECEFITLADDHGVKVRKMDSGDKHFFIRLEKDPLQDVNQ